MYTKLSYFKKSIKKLNELFTWPNIYEKILFDHEEKKPQNEEPVNIFRQIMNFLALANL